MTQLWLLRCLLIAAAVLAAAGQQLCDGSLAPDSLLCPFRNDSCTDYVLKTVCQRYCGICVDEEMLDVSSTLTFDTSETTTAEHLPDDVCEDESRFCRYQLGKCDTERIQKLCMKTCGLCVETSSSSSTIAETPADQRTSETLETETNSVSATGESTTSGVVVDSTTTSPSKATPTQSTEEVVKSSPVSKSEVTGRSPTTKTSPTVLPTDTPTTTPAATTTTTTTTPSPTTTAAPTTVTSASTTPTTSILPSTTTSTTTFPTTTTMPETTTTTMTTVAREPVTTLPTTAQPATGVVMPNTSKVTLPTTAAHSTTPTPTQPKTTTPTTTAPTKTTITATSPETVLPTTLLSNTQSATSPSTTVPITVLRTTALPSTTVTVLPTTTLPSTTPSTMTLPTTALPTTTPSTTTTPTTPTTTRSATTPSTTTPPTTTPSMTTPTTTTPSTTALPTTTLSTTTLPTTTLPTTTYTPLSLKTSPTATSTTHSPQTPSSTHAITDTAQTTTAAATKEISAVSTTPEMAVSTTTTAKKPSTAEVVIHPSISSLPPVARPSNSTLQLINSGINVYYINETVIAVEMKLSGHILSADLDMLKERMYLLLLQYSSSIQRTAISDVQHFQLSERVTLVTVNVYLRAASNGTLDAIMDGSLSFKYKVYNLLVRTLPPDNFHGLHGGIILKHKTVTTTTTTTTTKPVTEPVKTTEATDVVTGAADNGGGGGGGGTPDDSVLILLINNAIKLDYINDTVLRMEARFEGRLDNSVLRAIADEVHSLVQHQDVGVETTVIADIEDLTGTDDVDVTVLTLNLHTKSNANTTLEKLGGVTSPFRYQVHTRLRHALSPQDYNGLYGGSIVTPRTPRSVNKKSTPEAMSWAAQFWYVILIVALAFASVIIGAIIVQVVQSRRKNKTIIISDNGLAHTKV